MTKQEKKALLSIANDIRYLASLEHANFHCNEQADAEVKQQIMPYMQWFISCALNLESVVESDDLDVYEKKLVLSEICEHSF